MKTQLAYFAILVKSTDFKKVSQLEVQDVIIKLNDRPRKELNYKTPAKLIAEHRVTMAGKQLCASKLNRPTVFFWRLIQLLNISYRHIGDN